MNKKQETDVNVLWYVKVVFSQMLSIPLISSYIQFALIGQISSKTNLSLIKWSEVEFLAEQIKYNFGWVRTYFTLFALNEL